MTSPSAPSFCWHCGGALKLPSFEIVKDQLGHEHRVHKVCQDPAEEEVTQLTAYYNQSEDMKGAE
ncbi:MAG TPA: hypothetical protein VK149_03430 [Sideroxyarcus sp.]|nr:hypothetical protein [Sideroxyarcus sp.]